jgi:hypothetical protein
VLIALTNLKPLLAIGATFGLWFAVWLIVGPIVDHITAGHPTFDAQGREQLGLSKTSTKNEPRAAVTAEAHGSQEVTP